LPVFSVTQLTRFGIEIFKAFDAPDEEARSVSELLVEANLTGYDSHGVIRIPRYVQGLRSGRIKPGAAVQVLDDRPSTAVVDGNWGFGQIVAQKAMRIAIEKAATAGISSVGIRRCNHVGRLNTYSEMAARRGMIGIAVCNSSPHVAPFGGRDGLLGTNPICVAIPAGDAPPFVLDMATSVHAHGRVMVRKARGDPCPEGWLLDSEGQPTRDPAVLDAGGTIRPLGGEAGYKGYGLSLVVDVLGGILTGAGSSSSEAYRSRAVYGGNGVFMIVLNIENFLSLNEFQRRFDGLLRRVKTSRTAPGFPQILVPGEPERRVRERRSREGIFVEAATWTELRSIAGQLRIDISWMDG
jgi:uncharacterized oxidoreductase